MAIIKIRTLVVLGLTLFVYSCSHYDQVQANLTESKSGDDESHNSGKDCGSCHNKNGSEAVREGGWWTVSGTVYASGSSVQRNATIELWEKPNKQGKLIKRLVTDDKGNFYTNQFLNLTNGAYPVIIVGSNSKQMNVAFTGGSCNSCHGVSRSTLEIN
jgi:cytochrome c553